MIDGLRRGLLVVTGILVAGAAALLALSIGLVVEGTLLPAGTLQAILETLEVQAGLMGGFGPVMRAGLSFAWAAVMMLCFAPVVVSVLLGEVVRATSPLWYSGMSGLFAAAVPTMVRLFEPAAPTRSAQAATFEGRLTLVFFLTGVIGGGIYWLIAGRSPVPVGPIPLDGAPSRRND